MVGARQRQDWIDTGMKCMRWAMFVGHLPGTPLSKVTKVADGDLALGGRDRRRSASTTKMQQQAPEMVDGAFPPWWTENHRGTAVS